MKTNDFIMKKALFALTAMTMLTFFSCTVTDTDEVEIPEGPTELSFQVDFVKMYATEIKESEGERLEVSGYIQANIYSNTDVRQEYETLWNKYTSEPEYVTMDDLPMGSRAIITVDSDYTDYSYFAMVGSMTEVDASAGNDNEFMGEVSTPIDLLSITETQEFILKFSESSNQRVEAVYTIKRIQ